MEIKTFEELAKDEAGTIYIDAFENNVRYIIMRGPSAMCAYIGVPSTHPLAGHEYDDISLSVHGGLTFSGSGDDENDWPEGYYWYGWDYAHSGDKNFYDLEIGINRSFLGGKDKAWTVVDIQKEIWDITYEFAKLIKLSEIIFNKSKEAAHE